MVMRKWMSSVLGDSTFQKRIGQIAHDTGQSTAAVRAVAIKDLQEIGGRRSRIAMAIFAGLSRFVCRRGYHPEYCFDTEEFERIRELTSRKCVVFLVTHKTYLDFFVLYDFLYRHGVAPPYMFGGVNMAFSGMGSLGRRAGGIFIRRTFHDQPIYKAVLNRYIQSLVASDSSFCWAIEGTRSRTGKLVSPRIGLLKYVAQAAEPLGEDAITYVPVSVSYDHIPDVVDMVAEETGSTKKPESLAWFVGYVRRLSTEFGNIYIRFGEPTAFSDTPDAPDLDETQSDATPEVIGLQKLAFEICYHVNEVTPATVSSLVLMALLCHTAARPDEIRSDVRAMQHYLAKRQSASESASPNRPIDDDVDAAIAALTASGTVQQDTKGDYCSIVPERYLVALYYSNMAVHHFVIKAFTELGLLNVTHTDQNPGEHAFRDEVLRLRDLFKFEFFFARKERFRQQFFDELEYLGAPLDDIRTIDREQAQQILQREPLIVAHGVLMPFIHAYEVVADCLLHNRTSAISDRDEFVAYCQAESRKQRAGYPGFASKALLTNGYQLAENRGLLDRGAQAAAGRQAFADELQFIAGQLEELRSIFAAR